MTNLLRTITLAGTFVFCIALTPKASAQPLTPEKIQAKQMAVSSHAAHKRACKADAKKRGLHLKKRRAFIKDCMARK
jgi:hypothetical protein